MDKLSSSARVKMKRDTFYFPDSSGVYFRNNVSTFRMDGSGIDRWIEKLIPVFNGSNSLEVLTDGLPEPHRNRVYEIAQIFCRNGFARDVSEDRPHRLSHEAQIKFASQIELLDQFGGSGAHRFEAYRQTKVLAVGSGTMIAALIASLFESGLPKFHLLVTDPERTDRERLTELEAHARREDPETALTEISRQIDGFREAVRPFEVVLYVSEAGDVGQLREVHAACRDESKLFIPALCVRQAGFAGPVVHPDSDACWESAWRRVHLTAINRNPQQHAFSSTAGALLANVIVFEMFKTVTGVSGGTDTKRSFYLLDLDTLEGGWHSFLSHPLATGSAVAAERLESIATRVEQKPEGNSTNGLLPFFGGLTSAEAGIFHLWEEGDLRQLPLAQCRVQAVDPLSDGPAALLDETICSELTHERARKEAGLVGIEDYVARLADPLMTRMAAGFVGIGAGETAAEGIARGLHKCLAAELNRHVSAAGPPTVRPARLGAVEDDHCRYYLQALSALQGDPAVGSGHDVNGFPVMWVGTGERWYGSVGLNKTLALRMGLQRALQRAQNGLVRLSGHAVDVASVRMEAAAPLNLQIRAWRDASQVDLLRAAMQVLERNRLRLAVVDLAMEPFLKEGLAGVYGVSLREGVPG